MTPEKISQIIILDRDERYGGHIWLSHQINKGLSKQSYNFFWIRRCVTMQDSKSLKKGLSDSVKAEDNCIDENGTHFIDLFIYRISIQVAM